MKMEHDVTWQHFRRVLTHHWGVVLTTINPNVKLE